MLSRYVWSRAMGLIVLSVCTATSFAQNGAPAGKSFTTLQPGFAQEIVGVFPTFLGGVAFAPDGDPLVNECRSAGSPLYRFDLQGLASVVNGTPLFPRTQLVSNAGCGLSNHPNGSLYSNTSGGVVRLDANSGAVLAGPAGAAGNALGIAVDPQTGNLVYVGLDGSIKSIDPGLSTPASFSNVTAGNFVDGIYFDPTGNFLFAANRVPSFRLTVLRRDGTLVQHVPMTAEPDGIAFKASAPKFVVSSNTNGTMTRFDFPGDDFTQVPVQSVFASGGFRGDLSQVGPDSCLYLTQAGSRYNDNTLTNENSLVRVCPGFAPPPGVSQPKTLPENLACATNAIRALSPPDIRGPGQKAILLGLLGVVDSFRDTRYRGLSLLALNTTISRVDGCALRGIPDAAPPRRVNDIDFVSACPAQAPIYACLKDAQKQLLQR